MNDRCPTWLLVAAITVLLLILTDEAGAELSLELGIGHTYNNSLGNTEIDNQPVGTVELGYRHEKGFGVSYLHISNPNEQDYGINLFRVTKKWSW